MIYQLIIWLSEIYISLYYSIFCRTYLRTYLLMFVKYLTAQIFITEKTLLLFSCNFVEIEKCLLFQCHLAFTTVLCAAHSMKFS